MINGDWDTSSRCQPLGQNDQWGTLRKGTRSVQSRCLGLHTTTTERVRDLKRRKDDDQRPNELHVFCGDARLGQRDRGDHIKRKMTVLCTERKTMTKTKKTVSESVRNTIGLRHQNSE